MTKKLTLSPMDGGIIKLIESITGQSVQVEKKESTIVFRWSQPDPVNVSVVEGAKITALKDAIRGRLGDRFVTQHWEKGEYILIILPSEETQNTFFYDYKQQDYNVGEVYERTVIEVRAVQVRKDNSEELANFTGGGKMTQTNRVVYTFIDENGIFVDVPEGFYIVHDGSNYNVYNPTLFNYTFAKKCDTK